MKNSNDTIGNRTRELPACSAVPQPTAPPCAPFTHCWFYILRFLKSITSKIEKFVHGLGIANELHCLVLKKRYKLNNPTLHVMADVSHYQAFPDISSSNILRGAFKL